MVGLFKNVILNEREIFTAEMAASLPREAAISSTFTNDSPLQRHDSGTTRREVYELAQDRRLFHEFIERLFSLDDQS